MTQRSPLFLDTSLGVARPLLTANGDTLDPGILPLSAARTMVYSAGAVSSVVGNNSTARSSLLPADAITGNAYFKIPANFMPLGGSVTVVGFGNVGAATVAATTFTLYPWFQTTVGGTKTDCPSGGTAITIAAGVAANSYFSGTFTQVTATQIMASGYVVYAPQNGATLSWEINPNGTLVASDPTVDRYFGFDAAYGTANASNTETTLAVTAMLSTPFQTTQVPASLGMVIDGGGSALTTGLKGYIEVPANCTIQSSTLLADQSGSCVVDVWRTPYASFQPGTHPVAADTITASAPPTISSTYKAQDNTLTGWTKTLTKGDILGFNVTSATTITRVTISLKVLKQ